MEPKRNGFRTQCWGLSTALALSALCGLASAQTCERFQALSLDEQTQALASNDRSDPECTAYLVKNLGEARYEPAIRALAKYLDFEWQEPNPPVRQMAVPWDIDKVPAFQAMYSIGEKSAPAILDYLGSRDLPHLPTPWNGHVI
jgi:hypothetical protein